MPGSLFTVWIYPTLGEPITVSTLDFDSEEAAVEAVTESFARGTPFRIREHELGGDPGGTTIMVNPANVVAIRVRSPEPAGSSTGQYL
ncbi:hypothetical protein LQ327_22860 [Actinomycetospora endophytica]|uniref:Uncharacterized protein n=1 Tax=Actinomycetospora endophytica TaxID=2291215 RepID=A0ABS8PDI2_9PSEU|nr:hypothetical protein [Actinomycetospora endophytica]MCD2196219.1 hypothetical protein [Actinomycetospora endophytica]